MTTALSTMGVQQPGHFALVTESEGRTLATIRGLFDLENEGNRNRAWAALGRKEAAALVVGPVGTEGGAA